MAAEHTGFPDCLGASRRPRGAQHRDSGYWGSRFGDSAQRTGAVGFGRFGERAAADWYRHNGYRILATNWRCRQGELDLIVARDDAVVFVEVKARSNARFGTGAEAVDWRKQRKVRAVASRWLADQQHHYSDLRFDVVDVDRRGTLQVHTGCF